MFESMNKKTLIIAGSSVVGLLLVIILISFLVSSFSPSYISYDKFEERLSNAAKSYYKDNPSLLPTNDGETTLYYSTLEENGYMKPITKMLEKGESCTAEVIISKYGDNFSYIPYVTCPGEYETKELYRTVLENNKTVTEGIGLYRGSDSYYFRGEVKNNYIKLDETLWRIVKINNDNTMTIINDVKSEDMYEWDNRYNVTEKSKTGYNDFEVSRIKELLKEFASNVEILSDTAKGKLTPRNLCVGKRSLQDTDKSNSLECSTMSEDKYLYGLLTASEYMAASLDENCTNTTAKSCANYNFLTTIKSTSWTITGITDDTKSALKFDTSGLRKSECSMSSRVNITAFVSTRAFYKSGTGTLTDPYIVK